MRFRAIGLGAYLHAFRLFPENFAAPAFIAVTNAINEALQQAEDS